MSMMDKDYFLNAGIQQCSGLNCYTEQSFLNPNSSIDHYSHFNSPFSSMESSPAASTTSPVAATAAVAPSRYVMANNGHTNYSCFHSTLISPSRLHLQDLDQIKMASLENPVHLTTPPPPFAADPGFLESAAKFSCSVRNFSGGANPLELKNSPLMGNAKFSHVFNSPWSNHGGLTVENKNLSKKWSKLTSSVANSFENSSVSEQIPNGETEWKASNEMNFQKRNGKMKADGTNLDKGVAGDVDANSKRLKPTESCKNENGVSDNETEKRKPNQKPLKDYIHVRAKRGEATDSHSLAERVRREKISKRMKLLQDLVPGCNKVIGKAVMLDEIINYVESLQRQVEFLSMKLASVNPAASFYDHRSHNIDVNDDLLGQSSGDHVPLDASLSPNLGVQLASVDGFSESLSQFPFFCEDDLHSIVEMRFGQNPVNFPVENTRWETKGCL